jgi:hypothetical protein
MISPKLSIQKTLPLSVVNKRLGNKRTLIINNIYNSYHNLLKKIVAIKTKYIRTCFKINYVCRLKEGGT